MHFKAAKAIVSCIPIITWCCVAVNIIGFSKLSAQTLNTSTWITNAEVLTTTVDANYTYIGGRFTYIGPYTGNGGKFTTTSGNYDPSFPVVEGQVNAVAPDGSGGWYIGGAFTKVGGITRNRLAQIDASGNVTSWNPNANSTVNAITVSGADVYVGGGFSYIGGQSRSNAAKLNNTNGNADITWKPNPSSTVNTIVVNGTDIYLGGNFTSVGGQARNYIAKLNSTNGNADANWKPNANSSVNAIAVGGTDIYAVGFFSTIGGQTRNYVAKLNNTTGTADAAWSANADAPVYSIIINGSDVFVGGAFTNIGGQAISRIAKLSTAGGVIATWNTNADGPVYSIILNGNDLYVGGTFTNIGGLSRSYIAKLNYADGVADVNWNVVMGATVKSIGISGTDIYAGGDFTSLGGKKQNRIARIDNTTGNFDLTWNPDANNSVRAIAVSGNVTYVGGDFNTMGGQSRKCIAALDANGNVTDWNPQADYFVFALAVSGNTVYAAGGFSNIGGKARSNIAALDATQNTNNATNWNPNANNAIYSLGISGNTVYAGGYFTTIGGQTRNRIAALDAVTGNATSWNPNANNGIHSLALSGNTVYAGGQFTTIGGQTRNRIAALDAVTGNATSWNPALNGSIVYSILVSGNIVYVGGNFYSIGGQNRSNIAALDATVNSNNALTWNPQTDNVVNSIALYGSKVYIGGNFITATSQLRSYLAVFSGAANYWTGTVSNDWNTAANWSNNVVPTSTDLVFIPSGTPNAPDLNNISFSVRDFTQLSGQTLDLGSGNMSVTGGFTNNGTIAGTGKVILNGTSAQTITGNGTISNLELNNSTGATISSDTLKITGLLSLTSGTLTTNGRLILKSTSPTQTAMVGPVTSGIIDGNVIHERYLSTPANTSGGRGWRLITSPIGNNSTDKSVFYHWQNNGVNDGTGIEVFSASGTGANGNGVTQGGAASSLRTYNQLTNAYVPVTNTKTQQLFTGSRNNAFLAFVSGPYGSGNITSGAAATNSDATGTLITGTQTYTFTPPNATNIYELIGNPYACPIDFDKVYQNSNTSNINRMFWVIDPTLGNVGSYVTVTYNNGSYYASAGNQNQYIQTGQAFFVEGNNPGNQSKVEIKETNKETAAPQTNVFRGNSGSAETFRIQLYKPVNNNPALLDGTLAICHPNNSNAIDGNDAIKFGNFNEGIAILNGTKNLSIEARAPLQHGDSVKIALSNMQQGNYQLVFEPGNFNTTALTATLYDRLLNTATPVSLDANTTYHFTVASGVASYLNRFVVMFTNTSVLSLNFLAIHAKPNNGSNEVSWTVAGESGYSKYEVQRSSNGKDFYSIGMQAAAQQNSYRYTDHQPVNTGNYYRIKAISLSGNNVYSAVVHLGAKYNNTSVTIYPNPVAGSIMQLQLSGVEKGRYFVNIYNAAGQRSLAAQLVCDTGATVTGINTSTLPAGIYLMQVINENGQKISEQKIIRK